jgi:hypothetical protein
LVCALAIAAGWGQGKKHIKKSAYDEMSGKIAGFSLCRVIASNALGFVPICLFPQGERDLHEQSKILVAAMIELERAEAVGTLQNRLVSWQHAGQQGRQFARLGEPNNQREREGPASAAGAG